MSEDKQEDVDEYRERISDLERAVAELAARIEVLEDIMSRYNVPK